MEYEFGGLWQVERAWRLGLCDRAPAALIDDRPFGPLLTPMALIERGSALGAASASPPPLLVQRAINSLVTDTVQIMLTA